jgi:hypothetical protein
MQFDTIKTKYNLNAISRFENVALKFWSSRIWCSVRFIFILLTTFHETAGLQYICNLKDFFFLSLNCRDPSFVEVSRLSPQFPFLKSGPVWDCGGAGDGRSVGTLLSLDPPGVRLGVQRFCTRKHMSEKFNYEKILIYFSSKNMPQLWQFYKTWAVTILIMKISYNF